MRSYAYPLAWLTLLSASALASTPTSHAVKLEALRAKGLDAHVRAAAQAEQQATCDEEEVERLIVTQVAGSGMTDYTQQRRTSHLY